VDQTPQLADLPDVPRPGAIDDAPPLGPFRTFQTRIRDIAQLTGLALDQLVAVDRMPIAATLAAARVGPRGVSLAPWMTSTWRTEALNVCLA
jgi:endonuclease G